MQSFLRVYMNRKMAALLFLGFSSGLPLFLTSKTLQAWMTVEGVDLGKIGLFSLVGLPYSLKFIWSPLLDRFVPPFLGRRRGWLLLIQGALLLAIAAMALQQPKQALQLLAVNAMFIAFFSASQDIAFDAYRTDVLEQPEMGAGAAIAVLGYRIALLVTGSLAFILADRMPWSTVYLLMSVLMAVGLVSSFWAPEPIQRDRPNSLADAFTLPFIDFFQRLGRRRAVLILVFIVIYKLGDSLVKIMSTPFLLGLTFTQTELGVIQGGMGLLATIVGTLAGGSILSRIGINRSLWIFALAQAVGNLSYYALALFGKIYPLMVTAINLENFCAGLENAAFVAFLMSLCNQRFSATQYALLSSLMAFSRDILVAPSGAIAQSTGWPMFFLIAAIAALPGLFLLPFFAPWNPPPATAFPSPGLNDMRLTSLDVFRGLTIAGMILVNMAGVADQVYWPLDHAPWNGWTPTDLVFPFFLFIIGVAMAFSFARYTTEGNRPTKEIYLRILRRSLILFALGMLINGFYTYDFSTIRIMGVLQRISYAYLLSSIAVLNLPRKGQWVLAGAILIGYWLAMSFVPVPGYGAGVLTREGNLGAYLDRLIIGGAHLYKGDKWNNMGDPEGLFSTLPAVVSVLIGYFTGQWLRNQPAESRTSINIALAGLSCLVVGQLWGFGFPINKKLWTSSYVVFTAGAALLLLAACYELIDVRKRRSWGKAFEVMGLNAIFVFVASVLMIKILVKTNIGSGKDAPTTYEWINGHFFSWAGSYNGPLLFAILTVLFWWVVLYGMYRKGCFFRI